jgi:hypothetical protein
MAVVRCEQCGRPDGRKGNVYSPIRHYPVGHPNGGVVCGTPACHNPGTVWLTREEETEYQGGRRVFQITGGHMAVKFFVQ